MTHPSQERSTRTVTPPTTDNEPAIEALDRMTPVLAQMMRAEALCSKSHRKGNGEHYHLETVHVWARLLNRDRITARAALAAERASGGRWETFTDGDGEVGVRASGGLDVERLREAISRAGFTLWDNDGKYAVSRDDVGDIAAEYARLAT